MTDRGFLEQGCAAAKEVPEVPSEVWQGLPTQAVQENPAQLSWEPLLVV